LFGGYDESIVEHALKLPENAPSNNNPDGIRWMDINSESKWQVDWFQAKFGDTEVVVKSSKK